VTEVATMIRSCADTSEWNPDWDDVLRRAGQSRVLSRRIAAIAVVAAAGAVLLLPGIGVGGRLKDLIAGTSRPGIALHTDLVLRNGSRAGTLSASLVPGKLYWALALEGARSARSARVVLGYGTPVALCAPCRDGQRGTARTGRRPIWFGPRARVVLETKFGPAEGPLRISRPPRRG
jgi:hypothetical protein